MGFNWTDLVNGVSPVRVEEINAIAHAVLDSHPTDGVTGTTRYRTLLGADGLPVKSAAVTQTAGTPTTWVIRRTGKNMFDKQNMTFIKNATIAVGTAENRGVIIPTSENIAACVDYIPIIPGARLISRGIYNSSASFFFRLVCYDEHKNYVSYYANSKSGNRSDFAVNVPSAAHYFRFCCYGGDVYDVGGNVYKTTKNIQFEIVDNSSFTQDDATDYEDYSCEETTVTVTENGTPTVPVTLPTTAFGQNVVSLFPQGSLRDENPTAAIDAITETATVDFVARLDVTLAVPEQETWNNVTTLAISKPSHLEKIVILTTTANEQATVSITFPTGTRFLGATPTFGKGETWKIVLRDGIADCRKAVSA